MFWYKHLKSPILIFLIVFLSLFTSKILFGNIQEVSIRQLELNECLLPKDHPLQPRLKNLFVNSDMFKTRHHFRLAGFRAYSSRSHKIMVASHPSIKNFLIKKFTDNIPQKMQFDNYIKRISGARALRAFIQLNGLKHIVAPQKWLYPLPQHFSDLITGERTYVLIVEDMDICSGKGKFSGETVNRYATIDYDILRELCIALYYFRGLDSDPRNLPFTHDNKIAFIDTEHWEKCDRYRLLGRIRPHLNQTRQEEVLTILEELCAQDTRENVIQCPSSR